MAMAVEEDATLVAVIVLAVSDTVESVTLTEVSVILAPPTHTTAILIDSAILLQLSAL